MPFPSVQSQRLVLSYVTAGCLAILAGNAVFRTPTVEVYGDVRARIDGVKLGTSIPVAIVGHASDPITIRAQDSLPVSWEATRPVPVRVERMPIEPVSVYVDNSVSIREPVSVTPARGGFGIVVEGSRMPPGDSLPVREQGAFR